MKKSIIAKYDAYTEFCNKYFTIPFAEYEKADKEFDPITSLTALTNGKTLDQYVAKEFPNLVIAHLWNLPLLWLQTKDNSEFIAFRNQGKIPTLMKQYVDIAAVNILPDYDESASIVEFHKFCGVLFAANKGISRCNAAMILWKMAQILRYIALRKYMNEQEAAMYIKMLKGENIKLPRLIPALKMNSWSDLCTINLGHAVTADQWLEFVALEKTKYSGVHSKFGMKNNHLLRNFQERNNTSCASFDMLFIGAFLKEFDEKSAINPHWIFKPIDNALLGVENIDQEYSAAGFITLNKIIEIAVIRSTFLDECERLEYVRTAAKSYNITRGQIKDFERKLFVKYGIKKIKYHK